jgi:hypothetical protein
MSFSKALLAADRRLYGSPRVHLELKAQAVAQAAVGSSA